MLGRLGLDVFHVMLLQCPEIHNVSIDRFRIPSAATKPRADVGVRGLMAIDATPPNSIVATPSSTSGVGNSAAKSGGTATPGLADNFQTFLSLLTIQLKNQNPLDPLNINQFTQQLVQFAQVEQQLKGNNLLATLLNTQKAVQSRQALAFVGTTAVVEGSTATLGKSSAVWTMGAPKGVSAVVSITNTAGQTVYSGNLALNASENKFVRDGKSNDGRRRPDGIYNMTVTAKDGPARIGRGSIISRQRRCLFAG
jgi:flagellar basal-body rod modification protein FlgD